MSWALVDLEGGPVLPEQDGRYRIFEGGRYAVQAPRDTPVVLSHFALKHQDPDGFLLPELPLQVGQVPLSVQGTLVTLDIAPHQDKLDPRSWAQMLRELEMALPGGSLGHAGAGQGQVGSEGIQARGLLSSLLPLLPRLLDAVDGLLPRLRTRSVEVRESRPLRAWKRPEPELVGWLARRPRAVAWLLPGQEPSGRQPHPSLHAPADDLAHPANLALKWTLERVAARLLSQAESLSSPVDETFYQAWRKASARVMSQGARALRARTRRGPLAPLQPRPPGDAARLVFADDPLYARVHGLARVFLGPAFDAAVDSGMAAQAASFDVYERWTLVALVDALERALPGWSVERRGFGGVFDTQGRPSARFRRDQESLDLSFNLTFQGQLQSGGKGERGSISKTLRPDLVVEYRGPGVHRWVALDAKYRVHPKMLEQAWDSVHRYAHALWMLDPAGRRQKARGVLLLTPSMLPECAAWYSSGYHRQNQCGALELAPGRGHSALADWVLDTLSVER